MTKAIKQPTLTTTDINVLKFIVAYKRTHDGNSPSIRDIKATGLATSTSHISYVLDKLETFGYIKRIFRQARTIEILNKEIDYG